MLDNKSKTIAHLEEKWTKGGCPMCNAKKWVVSDKLFELREYKGGGLRTGGPIIPIIPVLCMNCGFVALVNALTAGLVNAEGSSQANVQINDEGQGMKIAEGGSQADVQINEDGQGMKNTKGDDIK